jgi:cytochrome subunit of sulfide dehydrogenase
MMRLRRRIRTKERCLALLLLASAAAPAAAADVIPPGARLAATCTGCHGTNGAGTGDALPSLAGQPKDALLAALKAFKSGSRPATVMTQLAKGYDDAQLEAIAGFFAVQGGAGVAGGGTDVAPQPPGTGARPAGAGS